MPTSKLPSAEDRLAVDRFLFRCSLVVAGALVTWLVYGFVRDPSASWAERFIVGIFALTCFGLAAIHLMFRTKLPALDRTVRHATVTGHEILDSEPDADGNVDPYDLLRVSVDADGASFEAFLADIVAPESFDRFEVGSTWKVYAFAASPLALGNDPQSSRVILTEDHDDVIRDGYNLRTVTLRGSHGTGSELLRRRFANDDSAAAN